MPHGNKLENVIPVVRPLLTRRLFRAVSIGIRVAAVASVGLIVSPLSASITANVNVNATQVEAVMSPMALGMHTSPYYNNMGNANVDDRLEEAGVTTLRFGGGGYADINHWSITQSSGQNGITGGGLSPWFGQAGNFGYVGGGSDFGSFVKLLDQTNNSQAIVTVNDGSAMKLVNGQSAVPDFGGQPKEAAAWVAYANSNPSIYGTPNDIPIGVDEQGNDWHTAGYWAKLRASTQSEYTTWATADHVYNPLNKFLALDRDAPVGIKYWEIGNETFGTGYYGGGNGYSVNYDVPYNGTNRTGNANLSPAHYGQEVVQYSQLMKSIDPTIKIGADLTTPPDDWSWDSRGGQHWTPQVLAQAASSIDFVDVHWYPWAGPAFYDSNGNGVQDTGEPLNYGNDLLAAPAAKIPGMIDGTGNHTNANAGIRDWLASFGIPNAQIMVTEFRYNNPENIQTANRPAADSLYVADAYGSWLERGVTSVDYLELMGKDFLSDSSSLTRGSSFYGVSMIDKLAKPGDSFVESDSSNSSVRVHAVRQADGSVAIMLLNLDLTNAADVTVDINGLLLGTGGIEYSLVNGTSMSQAAVSGLGNLFTIMGLPARSIETFIIAPQPMLLGDYNQDGIVDAADYIVWRQSLGQQGSGLAADGNHNGSIDAGDYDVWRTHFGQSASAGAQFAAGSAVPEPAASLQIILLATIGASQRRRRA